MGAIKPQLVHGAVLRQQFIELVQEIFIVVIDLKFKFLRTLEGTPRNIPGNCPLGSFAAIAVQPLRVFHLIQICRRNINTQLQSVLLA